jgi:hypothetical protein
MNFFWRFVILDFKKEMLAKEEEAEFQDYEAFFEAKNKPHREAFKAQLKQEKETLMTLSFSADDLKFISFIENDYLKDEFADLDPALYVEHEVSPGLERSQVQYFFLDF